MSRLDTWTPDELAAFLATTRGTRLEAAWHLLAFSGLRTGELLALRWRDIALSEGRLEVHNAVVRVPYTAIEPSPMCNRTRAIPLDPEFVALLRKHRERQEAERSEWGAYYRDGDLVVCRENGEPLHPRSLDRMFSRAAAGAGLRPVQLAAIRRTCPARSVRQVAPA